LAKPIFNAPSVSSILTTPYSPGMIDETLFILSMAATVALVLAVVFGFHGARGLASKDRPPAMAEADGLPENAG
jgi:hypothetical protein